MACARPARLPQSAMTPPCSFTVPSVLHADLLNLKGQSEHVGVQIRKCDYCPAAFTFLAYPLASLVFQFLSVSIIIQLQLAYTPLP